MPVPVSFREAAIEVLKAKGAPMKLGDIWAEIVARNLVESSGKTPEATLASILLRGSKNSELITQAGTTKDFVRTGPNTFALASWIDVAKPTPIEKVKARPSSAIWKQQKDQIRASASGARELVEWLIPDSGDRRAYLDAVARLITTIHATAPSAWSITMRRRALAVIVGRVAVLWLKRERITIVIDKSVLDSATAEAFGEVSKPAAWTLKSVSGLQPMALSTSAFADLLDLLMPAILVAAHKAADATSLAVTWRQHSAGMLDYIDEELSTKAPVPQLPAGGGADEIDLPALVAEFANQYALTKKGKKALESYAPQRVSARATLDKAKSVRSAGGDITDLVLNGLLPHRDTKHNKERGAWIHGAPAVTKDLREWYEASGHYQAKDWPNVATALLDLLTTVDESPDELANALISFEKRCPRGFRSGFLTPAFNALRPDRFLIINKKSIAVINELSGVKLTASLDDLLELNKLGRAHVDTIKELLPSTLATYLPSDVFDHFCHWLVAEKKFFEEDADDDEDDEDDEDKPADEDDADDEDGAQPPKGLTVAEVVEQTGFSAAEVSAWIRIWQSKHHLVLQGPPGTGKTFVARRLARLLAGSTGFVELVQFHPAYSYEDFIQGLRPSPVKGGLEYRLEPGRFLQFCKRAGQTQGNAVLIIDELNRANVPRVFGELMYLLEYREDDAPLAAGGKLKIPSNVFILGTMNTADRSIARMDHALRRRFAFVRLDPRYTLLQERLQGAGLPASSVTALLEVLRELNQEIGDPNFSIGISYFMRIAQSPQVAAALLQDIWRHEIEPYLDEYFHDNRKTAVQFSWDSLTRPDGALAKWTE